MRAPKIPALICAGTLAFGGTASLAAPDVATVLKHDSLSLGDPRAARAAATDPAASGASVAGKSVGGAPVDGKAVDGKPVGGGSVVVEANGAPAATAGAQQTQLAQERKKDNLFVRVITAPFRGLARLFGEGGGRKQQQAARAEETPRRESAAAPARAGVPQAGQQADAPRADQRSAQQLATVLPQPAARPVLIAPAPQLTAPASQSKATAAAPTTASPHVANPSPAPAAREGEEESYAPAPFIPLIVGVPGDPLSQGRALLEHGYLGEAISELSVAAVNAQNLVEANNLLGLAYDRRGWHRQAREAFERALSAAPNDPHVLSNLGYSLYLDDRHPEALGRLKQAARLAPGNPHILNNLALVYGRLQKYGEAFKHFERAGGELYARLQTGALLEAARRDHEAIKHYEAARRLDPASAEALRRLIPLYNRTGQREKAEAARRQLDGPNTKAAASTTG